MGDHVLYPHDSCILINVSMFRSHNVRRQFHIPLVVHPIWGWPSVVSPSCVIIENPSIFSSQNKDLGCICTHPRSLSSHGQGPLRDIRNSPTQVTKKDYQRLSLRSSLGNHKTRRSREKVPSQDTKCDVGILVDKDDLIIYGLLLRILTNQPTVDKTIRDINQLLISRSSHTQRQSTFPDNVCSYHSPVTLCHTTKFWILFCFSANFFSIPKKVSAKMGSSSLDFNWYSKKVSDPPLCSRWLTKRRTYRPCSVIYRHVGRQSSEKMI